MDDGEWVLISLGLLAAGVFGVWVAYNFLSQQSPGQLSPSRPPSYTYKNLEEWSLKRDDSGRLIGVDVHRKAERTE